MYSRQRGGLGVQSQTPKREVGIDTYPRRVVSLSKDVFTPRKVLVISRKRWHRADMKEIVDWDLKHLNTKNRHSELLKQYKAG